jgi:hypothetical protein
VGESSPPELIKSVDDYVRRVSDQIEMIQYIRGPIGEDRSTILDMGRVPDHGTGLTAPLAGQKRVPDSPEYSARCYTSGVLNCCLRSALVPPLGVGHGRDLAVGTAVHLL